MIRHLVLFRLREESERERAAHISSMRERLEALRTTTWGVHAIQVDQDVVGGANHWHAALVADFEDLSALRDYQVHPDHQAAVAWMADFVVERSVADLELRASPPL